MDHTDGRKVRKVTRACDACKAKKAKCSGTKPCDICTRRGAVCSYDALYLRGKPPTPPASATPGPSAPPDQRGPRRGDSKPHHAASPASTVPLAPRPAFRNSSEPGTADIHGQYVDPASALSFLHRARRRFSQGEHHSHTDLVKQEWLHQHVAQAGDKPLLGDDKTWVLPPYHEAMGLIEFYFDMCIATYRILHRPTVEQWLAVAENNRMAGRPIFHELASPRSAALLGVLAIATFVRLTIAGSPNDGESTFHSDCLIRQALRLTGNESGLPSLESIQARLVQVFYHLMTCRFNHAWYIFGSCLQMISAMGLQRRSSKGKSTPRTDYLPDQHRKRIFWSAYILDKYLGVVLGRPPHFHDEDIDQEFPDCVNDEDLLPEGPRWNSTEDCQVDAFIFNVKIARIVGSASRYLYGIQPSNESERLAAISRLGVQIDEWHDSLPPFLSTVKPSSLIRSLRRQSNALKLAHGHALMHLYRPLLLGNGTRQRRQSMVALIEDGSTRCIKAAWATLETIAAGSREGGATGAAFWWTHYVTFCALAVVYVWVLQRRRNVIERRADIEEAKLLDLAEICQHHLANATTLNSPSRKYSFILQELRNEARKPGVHSQAPVPLPQTPALPYAAPAAPPASGSADYTISAIDQSTPSNVPTQPSTDSMSLIDTPDWLTDWQNTDWLDLDASVSITLSHEDLADVCAGVRHPVRLQHRPRLASKPIVINTANVYEPFGTALGHIPDTLDEPRPLSVGILLDLPRHSNLTMMRQDQVNLCASQLSTTSPPLPLLFLYPSSMSMIKSSCPAPGSTTSSVRGCVSWSLLATDSMLSINTSPPPPQTRTSLTTLSNPLNHVDSAR